MAWTFYDSTDASAPVLTGEVGSLITLLDAVLVNGYGSKAAAGWAKSYSGTNKAAYRMGAGTTKYYLQVLDNGPGAGTAKEARIQAFQTMTDVDTGVAATGCGIQLFIRKSASLDNVARKWYAAGDDRTFILLQTFDSSTTYSGTYFGEFKSHVPSDPYGVCIIARTVENSASWTTSSPESLQVLSSSLTAISTSPGHYIARDTTQLVKSIACEKAAGFGPLGTNNAFAGPYTYPGFPNSDMLLAPVHLRHMDVSAVQGILRGQLRGVWMPLHSTLSSFFTPGDTFSGTGALAGKSFAYCGTGASATTQNAGFYILETTASVETT